MDIPLPPRLSEQTTTTTFQSIISDNGVGNSEWERGLGVINDILTPGSSVFEVMTEEQRDGLKSVQQILLGRSNEDQLVAYIPESLRSKQGREIDDYLISQFAGVRTVSAKQTFKNLVNANIFISGLKARASALNIEDTSKSVLWTNTPVEWDELDRESQLQIAELLSWESLAEWGFDIFKLNELTKGNALLFIGWGILSSPYSQHAMQKSLFPDAVVDFEDLPGYKFLDEFSIHPATMVNFLRAVQNEYLDIVYHNQIHAADVTQTLHCMLKMGGDKFASTEIQQFALLLAAIIHDMGHPGFNNNFQIQSRSAIAILYNDTSCLENMHIAKAFSLVFGDGGNPSIDIFNRMKPQQFNTIRTLLIDAVLDTDMTKHFATCGQIKQLVDVMPMEELMESDNAWTIASFFLHLADISNPAKPGDLFLQWTDRCLDEFFQQGDKEKEMKLEVSPLCDRTTTDKATSQLGFIKYVVVPGFKAVSECIPEIKKVIYPIMKRNYMYWKREQGKEEVDI